MTTGITVGMAVGLLSDCRTVGLSELSDCRITVGLLSDYCRITVGLLSEFTVGLSDRGSERCQSTRSSISITAPTGDL